MSVNNESNTNKQVAMNCDLAMVDGPASDLNLIESTPSSNSTSNEHAIAAAGNHVLAFPKTLIEMMDYAEEMNNKANKDSNSKAFCVAWLPDGNSFIVRDPAEFARSVIPKFFKPSKFTSFARKLYRWGFRQFTSPDTDGSPAPLDAVAFSAPFFKRDARHELSKMKNYSSAEKKRKGNSGAKRISFISTNSTSPNNEGDNSSENSQGPLKRRKLRQSAISPITDDGYEKDGKTNSDNSSGVSNNNIAAFPPFQQQANRAAVNQVNINEDLLQAYLGNLFANITQNNTASHDARRHLAPQPKNQASLSQLFHKRIVSEDSIKTNFFHGSVILQQIMSSGGVSVAVPQQQPAQPIAHTHSAVGAPAMYNMPAANQQCIVPMFLVQNCNANKNAQQLQGQTPMFNIAAFNQQQHQLQQQLQQKNQQNNVASATAYITAFISSLTR